MALANKCDRCGKLYERRVINDAYKIKKLLPYTEENVDLCFECQEAFEKFMKSYEKEKEKKIMPIMRKCNRCGKSYVRSITEDKYRATKVFPCAIKTIFLCKDCQKEFENLIENFIRKGEES